MFSPGTPTHSHSEALEKSSRGLDKEKRNTVNILKSDSNNTRMKLQVLWRLQSHSVHNQWIKTAEDQ